MNAAEATRLLGFASTMFGAPFEWGRTDCVALAARAVSEVYEVDLFERLAPDWRTEAEARARIAGERVDGWLRSAGFWLAMVPRAGDVLVCRTPIWPLTVHVCLGARCLSASPGRGVGYVRTAALEALRPAVWRRS